MDSINTRFQTAINEAKNNNINELITCLSIAVQINHSDFIEQAVPMVQKNSHQENQIHIKQNLLKINSLNYNFQEKKLKIAEDEFRVATRTLKKAQSKAEAAEKELNNTMYFLQRQQVTFVNYNTYNPQEQNLKTEDEEVKILRKYLKKAQLKLTLAEKEFNSTTDDLNRCFSQLQQINFIKKSLNSFTIQDPTPPFQALTPLQIDCHARLCTSIQLTLLDDFSLVAGEILSNNNNAHLFSIKNPEGKTPIEIAMERLQELHNDKAHYTTAYTIATRLQDYLAVTNSLINPSFPLPNNPIFPLPNIR